MNVPLLKRVSSILKLVGVAGLLAASSAYVQAIPSDTAVLRLNGNPVETLGLDEGNEGGVDPGTFFDTTHTGLFNQNAGVVFFLEPGGPTPPSGSFVIGTDHIPANQAAFLSDVFGVNNQNQNDLFQVGFMSGIPDSASDIVSFYESWGREGHNFSFLVETGSEQDLSAMFLTSDAIGRGYTVTFFSDVDTVPDGGTTVSLLGVALAGIALLNLKLRRSSRIAL
jgi:hypothetical protein